MKLDVKQKVLLAIYMEYQKDIPIMESVITAKELGLTQEVFTMALRKLENEGLIQDIDFIWADNEVYDIIFGDMLITNDGIDYVE